LPVSAISIIVLETSELSNFNLSSSSAIIGSNLFFYGGVLENSLEFLLLYNILYVIADI